MDVLKAEFLNIYILGVTYFIKKKNLTDLRAALQNQHHFFYTHDVKSTNQVAFKFVSVELFHTVN